MGETEWLDGEEMALWRAFVDAAGSVFPLLGAALKADADMAFEDYEVLVHLSEASDGKLRMTDLSRLCLHSQSRLTQRVDRLVGRGWVAREKCPDDRRGMFAVLTPDGLRTLEAAAPGHVAEVRRLIVDLVAPGERAVVARVLARIAARATT